MIFIYNNKELNFNDLVEMDNTPFVRYNKELNYLICKDNRENGEKPCRFRMAGLSSKLVLDTLNELLNIYGSDVVLELKED